MSRAPRTRCARRLSRALVAAAVAVAVAVPGLAASAANATSVAEVAPVEDAAAELVIAPSQPVLRPADLQFRFDALLRNLGEEELGTGTLTLWVDGAAVQTRAELTEGRSEGTRIVLTEVELGATAVDGEQSVRIDIARDDLPASVTSAAGVHVLHAEFTPTGRRVAKLPGLEQAEAAEQSAIVAATPFVWSGVTATPVPLTLVVPLVLPASVRTVPNEGDLSTQAPRLLQLLTEAERRHATIGVDPRIVVGIRGLGDRAPASAAELLSRLETSPGEVFLLQFADADPATQAALGFDALMQPIGFEHVTRFGSFEQAGAAEPAPADGTGTGASPETAGEASAADAPADAPIGEDPAAEKPAADEPAAATPSLDELMSLPNATARAWPADGQADHATLALLRSSELTSVVLASNNLTPTAVARARIGDFSALVTDAELNDAARRSIEGASAIERRAARAELSAELALAAQQGTTGLALGLDRGAMAEGGDTIQRTFETIDSLPWAQPVAEAALPEGTGTLRQGAQNEQHLDMLRAALERSSQIDALAPLLEQPQYLPEWQRARVLSMLSTRYTADDTDFDALGSAIERRDATLLEGVHPVTTENTQLVSTSSRVPVTLRNELPFDAKVILRAAPASAAILVPKRSFNASVPANGNSNVLVEVHTRVSTGVSGLELQIVDAGSEQSFAGGTLQLTLRAAVETIVMTVLGAAAAALFGFGIWRSIKRRRHESSERSSASAE